MGLIDAACIVARCKSAGLTCIYKSYIKDIQLVDIRKKPDWIVWERDFSFMYKGSRFIVREKIEGDKRYSTRTSYTVEVVPKWCPSGAQKGV